MQNTSKIILLFVLILLGCGGKENIILNGNLDNKFNSQILLTNRGDKYEGYFSYEEKGLGRIKIRGVRIGETLRLEEFFPCACLA